MYLEVFWCIVGFDALGDAVDACTELHHDKGRLQRELKYFKSQVMQEKAFITYDNKPTPSTRSIAIVIT